MAAAAPEQFSIIDEQDNQTVAADIKYEVNGDEWNILSTVSHIPKRGFGGKITHQFFEKAKVKYICIQVQMLLLFLFFSLILEFCFRARILNLQSPFPASCYIYIY